jgi:hypothetical protein
MKMRSLILNFFIATNFGFCDVFTYSQNTPPPQYSMKDQKLRDYPFLINGSLIISKIDPTPVNAFYTQIISGTNSSAKTYVFRNKEKIGYRFGMGVGFGNGFDLSVQYTHLRGGNHSAFELPVANLSTVPFVDLQNVFQLQPIEDINFVIAPYSKQKMREQTLDLHIQTAYWMNTRLRFFPFGGIRLQSFRRDLMTNTYVQKTISTQKKNFQNLNSKGKFRLKQMGAFLGTDVQYTFTRRFSLFSSVAIGLLTGSHKRCSTFQWLEFNVESLNESLITSLNEEAQLLNTKILSADTPKEQVPILKEEYAAKVAELNQLLQDEIAEQKLLAQKEKIISSFNPFLQLKFGFSYDDILTDKVLVSFKAAYELKVQYDPNALSILPMTQSSASPLRFNNTIQTSAIVIGLQFKF